MNIQDNSGVSSSFYYSDGINISAAGYTQLRVSFWFYTHSMDNSAEDFRVQYYNGSNWQTVASYAQTLDFQNNQFYFKTIYLDRSQYTFPPDMKIRFMCDASGNTDDVYIDEIEVAVQ